MLGMNELAAAKSSGGFSSSTLIFIVIIIAVVYLLLIRPQQRRKQQAQQKQDNVRPGARVRTTAGMYATVVAVDGDDVVLEVAPGIECRYMKRAIMDVVSPAEETDEPDSGDAEEEEDYTEDETSDEAAPGDEAADDVPESDEDSEEAAYEQATGTKKD